MDKYWQLSPACSLRFGSFNGNRDEKGAGRAACTDPMPVVAVVFRSGVLPLLESQRFRILHVVATVKLRCSAIECGSEIRAKTFNFLNHTNFQGVSTALGSTNYGQVTSGR